MFMSILKFRLFEVINKVLNFVKAFYEFGRKELLIFNLKFCRGDNQFNSFFAYFKKILLQEKT